MVKMLNLGLLMLAISACSTPSEPPAANTKPAAKTEQAPKPVDSASEADAELAVV